MRSKRQKCDIIGGGGKKMKLETLGLWRDLAVILLLLQVLVMLAIPGVALFFAQKYLRIGRKALRLPLLRVQVFCLRVEQVTQRSAAAVVGVPIGAHALSARVRATARTLLRSK